MFYFDVFWCLLRVNCCVGRIIRYVISAEINYIITVCRLWKSYDTRLSISDDVMFDVRLIFLVVISRVSRGRTYIYVIVQVSTRKSFARELNFKLPNERTSFVVIIFFNRTSHVRIIYYCVLIVNYRVYSAISALKHNVYKYYALWKELDTCHTLLFFIRCN